MNISELTNVVQLGIAGFALWLFYKIQSNHLNHMTEALEHLTEAIVDLKTWLKDHV